MSGLLVEQREGIVLLTLDNPSQRNVLSSKLCAALSKAVAAAEENADAKAIVITGTAPAFCAGADLEDLKAAARGEFAAVNAVYKSFMDVANSTLPTLAAVNGPAVGAGFNLALACDMRIASESAKFDTRFLKLGLHPGGGHAWMLLRAVGWSQASFLLLTGQSVNAREAHRVGLVECVVPDSDLSEQAFATLKRTAAASRELVLRTKATMRLACASDHRAAFVHETAEQKWSLEQSHFAEAIARAQER